MVSAIIIRNNSFGSRPWLRPIANTKNLSTYKSWKYAELPGPTKLGTGVGVRPGVGVRSGREQLPARRWTVLTVITFGKD